MKTEAEGIVAARREKLVLHRQQMEALDSPLGLTDEMLRECYDHASASAGIARTAGSQLGCDGRGDSRISG